MPWNTVECHPNTRASLVSSIQKRMLSGTHLLYGPPGAGQLQVARAIAKSLLCTHNNGDFCDQCTNCLRIESHNYPDLFELWPHIDWAKEERKGREYSIDHMRMVQKAAQTQPYEGNLKIFILNDAERLRVESANCLLKILEEPYPHTLFILLTANISRILSTILSRCRKIRLPQMSLEDVSQRLNDEITPQQAITLARVSGGYPERARQLHQEGYLDQRDEVFGALLKIKQEPSTLFALTEQWSKSKESLDNRLTILASIMRDGMIISSRNDQTLNNPDIEDSLNSLWNGISTERFVVAIEKLLDAQENIDRYVNAALILSEILIVAFSKKSLMKQ